MDKVASRLRKAGFYATTVYLRLRWSDFSTITRQTKLSIPARDDITLRETGMELLNEHLRHRPVRLIGFGVSGLVETDKPQTLQMNLFEPVDITEHQKRDRLSEATDHVREKYGLNSLRRGSDLGT
jgi:DNA polymerase-4